jgi:hypothetical protein
MNITQEIRAAPEAGMQDKSKEFKELGVGIYLKEEQVPAPSGE